MPERFEDQKKPEKKDGLPEHVLNEVLQGQQQKAQNTQKTETAASDDYWSKHMKVVGNGLLYTGQGIWNGIKYNASHPVEFATKMVTAYGTGMLIRRFMPDKGATKALAGTLMLGYFLYDGLNPCIKAWHEATEAKTDADLDKAARRMGNGLGLFTVDSVTGGIAGYRGDRRMANHLKSMDISTYLAIERSRATSWSPENNPVERGLQRVASTMDGMFDKAANSIRPAEVVAPKPTLTAAETREAIVHSARVGAKNMEESVFWRMGDKERTLHTPQNEGGFYRRGEPGGNGKRVGFSETIDGLLGASKEGADGVVAVRTGEPHISAARTEPTLGIKSEPKGIAGEKFPDPLDVRAPGDGGARPPSATKLNVSPENEPVIYDRLAAEAKRRQEAWTQEAVAIADYKDMIKGPLWGVIDTKRPVPLYEPIYELPNRQLMAITDQIATKEEVQMVGQLLEDHASAALQNELGVPLVRRLNVTGEAYISALLQGMKRVGIEKPVLEGKAVTKFSVGGADNYTQPHIFGQVDGAVTKYPRTQIELRGAFNNINGHEVYGHTGLFRELAEFTPEQINTIIPRAVDNAMRKAGVAAEATVEVPGKGPVQVKEVLRDILIAQRNENTSDLGATAQTVMGPADSLAVLLMSLRQGGKLESRSVMGSRFPDFYEAHGIDGWRLELMRQTIIERAKFAKTAEDKALMNKLADELGQVKDQIMRPGTNYVWASTDKKGEFLALPRTLVDALAKELVVAQYETPLVALTDKKGVQHTLNEIMPDIAVTWKKISFLADQMVESAGKGKTQISTPFNKNDYWPQEVDAAGLLAWKRTVAKGQSESKAIDAINVMWDNLMDHYVQGNPYSVSSAPISTLTNIRQQPLTMARRALATSFGVQKWAREHTDRNAWLYAPMATSLAVGETWHAFSPANNPENPR